MNKGGKYGFAAVGWIGFYHACGGFMIPDYEQDGVFINKHKRRESKFKIALNMLINGRKLKSMGWPIEHLHLFDFYRFFKRHGKIRHAAVMMDECWGPYFKEAVIAYKDFVVSGKYDNLGGVYVCMIYHKSEKKIRALWKELDAWIIKNNTFRGKQFTFPALKKPKMAKAYFINDREKTRIEENTLMFFRKLKYMKKSGMKPRRGIVLYGNPGNGKTSICRWISKNLPDVTRIWVTDWHFKPYAISDLFDMARKLSPSIIFLEDIDTAGISRHITGRMNPLLGKLLNEMDGIQRNDGIVVVATTNNIYVLDQALANRPGRFDLKIRVGNPHPRIVKQITGHEDNITLAEAFRRKEERIFYEKVLGKKYKHPVRQYSSNYIG